MIHLTKNQAEYVQIANERFGHPGKINRKEMKILVDEKLVDNMAIWLQKDASLRLDRSYYKLPTEGEYEIRPNKARGRKKKVVEVVDSED
jgi:hypothetical protein